MISRIRALLSSIDLRQLDTRRIDLAMAWAQRHPLATAVYNLGNYFYLGVIKTAQLAVLAAVKVRNRLRSAEPAEALPAGADAERPVRVLPPAPRILILAEASIPQCYEYRVRQKLEMLAEIGWEAAWLPWSDIDEVRRELHFRDVLVLYRVPGFDAVLDLIEYAHSLNKLLIYDLDDLVFDRDQLEKKFSRNRGQLSHKVYRELLTGADLYRKSMSLIPYCITSTVSLKERVEGIEGVTGHVLPNGLSTTLLNGLEPSFAAQARDRVTIFYGSGTSTHDADFRLVTPVLLELLDEHPSARLVIAGPLLTDPEFGRFGDRVQSIEFLDYASYLEVLACAHINIAPLEPGVFADCKSEIKWIEAGMLGVPSVVSATRTFGQSIEPGETGYLADTREQWQAALSELVRDPDLRRRIGENARSEISRRYSRQSLAGEFKSILERCIEDSPRVRREHPAAGARRRLLLVNTLYPPQSMGGATRIVKGLVDNLHRRHGDDWDVTVFTCDVHDTRPYYLREYVYEGAVVLSLSVPMRPDLERLYEDDRVLDLFDRALAYYRPALVHFHSVQRLTASMLLAAEKRRVPYVVTLHDSWWISDFPFMIDDRGNALPHNVSNPIVAAAFSTDAGSTARRNRYLRERLHKAHSLVAVSEYQRSLYSDNGFPNTVTIENGVDAPAGFARNGRNALVLGYAGGRSTHKGYYFLKECVSDASLEHTEVVVVDLFSKSNRPVREDWGGTPVEVHPRFEFSNIGAFYSLVDVMVVPSMWPESFGLVVREAALLGLWVVASDSGGLRGAVIEGRTGFTYPQGDRGALLDILAALDREWRKYKKPPERSALDGLGIRSVEQNAEETLELYHRVIADSAG